MAEPERIRRGTGAMPARDPTDRQRGVSPLELLFDLCFVVAIAQATTGLTGTVVAGSPTDAVVGYLSVFFAVWWAWMNFTWFASAFDNDDVLFRLAALMQILGALILAAGTESAFREQDFTTVFHGYAVMRASLIALWLRAARSNPSHRTTALRYALGLLLAMTGWSVMFIADAWPLWGWSFMAAVELAIPVWAEARGATPWNPYHIARRYGRFLIIVLGQSVLAITNAAHIAFAAPYAGVTAYTMMGGGLAIVFAMWWLYFAVFASCFLHSNRFAFIWGYGHFFVFASAAAVGSGIAVHLEQRIGDTVGGDILNSASLTVPVAIFLFCLHILHRRPGHAHRRDAWLFPLTLVAVVGSTWTQAPVVLAGMAMAGLVATTVAAKPEA